MKLRHSLALIFLIALSAAAFGAPVVGPETPLEFTLKRPDGSSAQCRRRGFVLNGLAPTGTRLPKFNSSQPIFAVMTLAGRDYTLAFDKTNPNLDNYDTLYFDASGHNDLEYCESIRATIDKEYSYFRVKLDVGEAGERLPFRFIVRLERIMFHHGKSRPEQEFDCVVRAVGWWMGTVIMGLQKTKVALLDNDCNASYGDFYHLEDDEELFLLNGNYVRGDNWIVYDNKESKVDSYKYKSFGYGGYIKLEDGFFQLRVRQHDGRLWAYVVKPEMGIIESREGEFSIDLSNSHEQISIESKNGSACVPVGVYDLLSWSAKRKARDGKVWGMSINPAVHNNVDQKISIKPRSPVKLNPPQYLRYTIDVDANGSSVYLTTKIMDEHGQEVVIQPPSNDDSYASLLHPLGTPGHLQLRIVDAKGNPVARREADKGYYLEITPATPKRLIAYIDSQGVGPFRVEGRNGFAFSIPRHSYHALLDSLENHDKSNTPASEKKSP